MNLSDFETHELVAHYRATKEKLDAKKAAFKKEAEPDEAVLKLLDGELMRRLADNKQKSFAIEGVGTFTRTLRTYFTIADPQKFNDFVVAREDITFLNKTPNTSALNAYREENGEYPPGIVATQEYAPRFTKAK